jgi:hypothetical protein
MPISLKSSVAFGCVCAVMLGMSACEPRHIPAMTVTDLMEDRVALDGVLMKCNQDQSKSRSDVECMNARVAIERLAKQSEPAEEAKRTEEFERSREKLRIAQEKQRQEQAAKTVVDAYHLPLVPVEPAPPPAPPPAPAAGSGGANPPLARDSTP